MTDVTTPKEADRLATWNTNLDACVCEACDAHYLLPPGFLPPQCPNCGKQGLTLHPGGMAEMPHAYPPEQVIPFTQTKQAVEEAIHHFREGIPYPPSELEPAALRQRLMPVFLPMWLVDANVFAYWQAQAGYGYTVVSHQEQYQENAGWRTREVKEDRVRWEPRIGRIKRTYQNVAVPALYTAFHLESSIGPFDLSAAQPYGPGFLCGDKRAVSVRLPDHTPKESWNDAAAVFQKTATEECQLACSADQMRQFRWKAQFTQLNWTLLLLPAYVVEYLDDSGATKAIWINGQTGKISGERRASMRAAVHSSLTFFGLSLLLLLVGVGMGLLSEGSEILEFIALFITLVGVTGIAGSLIPFARAWDYNRKQSKG